MPKEQLREDIIKTEFSDIMKRSYIDYAMSVIISRALPDVRDGLKPVQRRTLYDMSELKITSDKPYRKCARVVGDTMGKYHPHGDSSIYEALVVMAQDFKKGMVLVDGHGNFGSIEGDGAAAMRYTECRLSSYAQNIFLSDLDKDVVDYVPNFDETEKEPSILPAKVSNLLVNGAEGIAVGMATSIPTHNLGEVIDGTIALIKNENITVKGLMKYIQAPDFPTGGIITNKEDMIDIYKTGQGKIKIRGRVEIEKGKSGKNLLVIKEIPYTMIGSGITKFLCDVAALTENKVTTDITDISNQSSKEGIRIVIETKKDADLEYLTNLLYKKTKLEDTFSVNMLAVADGRPETLSLKDILSHSVNFQFEIANRKYTNLLDAEENKKEIQEGLIKAVDVIDLIIEILRGSQNLAQAKDCLINGNTKGIKFKSKASEALAKMLRFTEKQAKAILEMRLQKLIGLEIDALKADYDKTLENIKTYKDILENYDSMAQVIIKELKDIKKKYATPRKTDIEDIEEVVLEEKEPEEEEIYFLMDRFGYTRCVDTQTFERNKEAALQENIYCFPVMNTGKVCIFTSSGSLHTIKVKDIPFGKFRDKGTPIDNISNFDNQKERFIYVCDYAELFTGNLLFVSKLGQAKTTHAMELVASKKTIAATKLSDGDELLYVNFIKDTDEIIFVTSDKLALRIPSSEIPEKGKVAIGVKGITLNSNQYLKNVLVINEECDRIKIGGKEVALDKIKLAKRAGKGSKI